MILKKEKKRIVFITLVQNYSNYDIMKKLKDIGFGFEFQYLFKRLSSYKWTTLFMFQIKKTPPITSSVRENK